MAAGVDEHGLRPLIRGLAEETKAAIAAAVAPLTARLAAVEARPELKYCGTWEANRVYAAGSVITFKTGIWIARGATAERPGNGLTEWQLAMKSVDGRREDR